MRSFRDRPIKQKLVVIVMATTARPADGWVWHRGRGFAPFRGFLERDLSALARIVADDSTGALSFNDPQAAGETLAALRAKPNVTGACIYRQAKTIFATYSRQGPFTCPRRTVRITSGSQ